MNYEMLGINNYASPAEALQLDGTIKPIPITSKLSDAFFYFTGVTKKKPENIPSLFEGHLKSSLDRVYIPDIPIGSSGVVDESYNIPRFNVLNVDTLPKDSYWKILDSESDLREYVRYLALWPAFGLNLNGQVYGIEENNINAPVSMMLSNPLVLAPSSADRTEYIKRINNFYDVVLWKFLKDAQAARGLLSTYDESTILSASLMVDQVLSKVPEFLNTQPEIRINVKGIQAVTIQTWGIPGMWITTTFQGKTYGLRQALKAQYNRSSIVFLAAKEILLAHLASLMDPSQALRLSKYANDPQFNLFLIWSGYKDEKGKTVYTDRAVNQTPGNVQRQAEKILVPYGPTAKNFEAVPLIKQYLYRGTTGQSMADIDRSKTENKSNMGTLLLVAGGIAAAAIASKYA